MKKYKRSRAHKRKSMRKKSRRSRPQGAGYDTSIAIRAQSWGSIITQNSNVTRLMVNWGHSINTAPAVTNGPVNVTISPEFTEYAAMYASWQYIGFKIVISIYETIQDNNAALGTYYGCDSASHADTTSAFNNNTVTDNLMERKDYKYFPSQKRTIKRYYRMKYHRQAESVQGAGSTSKWATTNLADPNYAWCYGQTLFNFNVANIFAAAGTALGRYVVTHYIRFKDRRS